MASRQPMDFNIWTITVLMTFTFCTIQLADAQTQVGFEFLQQYSSIAPNVETFKSFLVSDIVTFFNFSATEVTSKQVTSGSEGRIRVNFTLQIDTSNDAKVLSRIKLERSLRDSDYVLTYNGTNYRADGSTVSVTLSAWDIFHQYIPEIVIAVICGLAAFALFVASLQLLCINRKRQRRASYTPKSPKRPSYGNNSMGRVNGGFVMEEINGGQRVHTPKSSIGSTRFGYDRDTLYDKLIYGAYEVPPKHMYSFL